MKIRKEKKILKKGWEKFDINSPLTGEAKEIYDYLQKEKDKTLIPEGDYCYTLINVTKEGKMNMDVCPYWSCVADKPGQDNGYCSYMEEGDWEHEGVGLLWDMVKECGENRDE